MLQKNFLNLKQLVTGHIIFSSRSKLLYLFFLLKTFGRFDWACLFIINHLRIVFYQDKEITETLYSIK